MLIVQVFGGGEAWGPIWSNLNVLLDLEWTCKFCNFLIIMPFLWNKRHTFSKNTVMIAQILHSVWKHIYIRTISEMIL